MWSNRQMDKQRYIYADFIIMFTPINSMYKKNLEAFREEIFQNIHYVIKCRLLWTKVQIGKGKFVHKQHFKKYYRTVFQYDQINIWSHLKV